MEQNNKKCNCCCVADKRCAGKVKVIMELVKATLLYDIANTAYLYTKSLRADGVDEELKSDIYDLCRGGNADITARYLDEAVAACRAMLTRFHDKETRGGYYTNNIEECVGHPANADDYYIILSVPATYDKANTDALFHAAMHYIIDKTIASYLALVYPNGAGLFLAKANEHELEIYNLTKRMKPGSVRIVPRWI